MTEQDEERPLVISGREIADYSINYRGEVFSRRSRTRPLKLSQSRIGGYPVVSVRDDGKTVQEYVHRLVAEAFIGPCPHGQEVCHNDGNRQNPMASNLRYGTRKENLADRERHGTAQRGEKNPSATLTDSQAEEIRQLRRRGLPLKVIAEKFSVRESTVSRIANGVRRALTKGVE